MQSRARQRAHRDKENAAHIPMTTFPILKLTGKVLLARWLRMRIKVSEGELDYLMRVSAEEPTLRCLLEDCLAARR